MFPIDGAAQQIGRSGEIVASQAFDDHGWIVVHGPRGTDFGLDLSLTRRDNENRILPYILSAQVKAVRQCEWNTDASTSVPVRASTLASWLWSTTPVVVVLVERSTCRLWWALPAEAAIHSRKIRAAQRNIRFRRPLESKADWTAFDATITRLWRDYRGISAIHDLPLVLQTLTETALATGLWTDAQDLDRPELHTAAVHVYRTVASLNALSGRQGSDEFNSIAQTDPVQFGTRTIMTVVDRGREVLGVLSAIESIADPGYLLDVFGLCGHEINSAVKQLQRLARLREFEIDHDLRSMLERVTDLQLAIVDPEHAHTLGAANFRQLGQSHGLGLSSDASLFDIDRRIELRLAPTMAEPIQHRLEERQT